MEPDYVAAHLREDRDHWWFRGRRAVLRGVLQATLPRARLRLVEIGCGSGALLPVAAEFGDAVGVEASGDFLEAARQRGFTVLSGSLPDRLPLEPGAWDAVLLFDVLEHIEHDRAALRAVWRILRPGGWLICTVPAYNWLWTSHDETLGHWRRYTAGEMRRLAAESGFHLVRVTYFNTLLALPIVAVRLLGSRRTRGLTPGAWGPRAGTRRSHDLIRPAPLLNALLARIFSAEATFLGWMNLPFGVSVLLVARRPAC